MDHFWNLMLRADKTINAIGDDIPESLWPIEKIWFSDAKSICRYSFSDMRHKKILDDSASNSTHISAKYVMNVIDRLKMDAFRSSTACNYLNVWRSFNKFLIRLDGKPKLWEEWTMMFCAYLIYQGTIQSSTVKFYV